MRAIGKAIAAAYHRLCLQQNGPCAVCGKPREYGETENRQVASMPLRQAAGVCLCLKQEEVHDDSQSNAAY